MSFHDIVTNLSHGKLPEAEAEERVNPDEPQEEVQDQVADPDQDEPQDKPDEEPESEADAKPEEETEETAEAEVEESATDATDEDKEAEPTVEIDGEQVPLSMLREWRDRGLMREDYSRKTGELSDQKKKFQEEKTETQTLARDIAKDVALQQFLSARPEAIADLIANPKDTRALIGNPKAVETFWKQYDILRDNPELAEKFVNSEPSEAERELAIIQERKTVDTVIDTLEGFIGHVYQEAYEDLGIEAYQEVSQYIAGLSGVPENPGHDDLKAGAERLFSLFYRQLDDGEWTIDHRLIQGEFERFKAIKGRATVSEPAKPDVDEHNRKVDEQLKTDERPPKTPDGLAPSAEGEKQEIPGSLQGILGALSGHGG